MFCDTDMSPPFVPALTVKKERTQRDNIASSPTLQDMLEKILCSIGSPSSRLSNKSVVSESNVSSTICNTSSESEVASYDRQEKEIDEDAALLQQAKATIYHNAKNNNETRFLSMLSKSQSSASLVREMNSTSDVSMAHMISSDPTNSSEPIGTVSSDTQQLHQYDLDSKGTLSTEVPASQFTYSSIDSRSTSSSVEQNIVHAVFDVNADIEGQCNDSISGYGLKKSTSFSNEFEDINYQNNYPASCAQYQSQSNSDDVRACADDNIKITEAEDGAQSIASSQSASFNSAEYNIGKVNERSSSSIQSRKRCMKGPAIQKKISTSKTASHGEFVDTYESIRVENDIILDVLNNVDCILPHRKEMEELVLNGMRGTKYSSCISTNVWSEPVATITKVRGTDYLTDGMKVCSEESMFAMLGVDNMLRKAKNEPPADSLHCCRLEDSYLNRLRKACLKAGVEVPFLLVINLVVPWGNLLAYMYRPDGTNGGPFNDAQQQSPAEKAWRDFMNGDEQYRNQRLKFIPHVCVGPWIVKKSVGSSPVLIGQKMPVSYFGSIRDNYLEICLDVTRGGHMANSISNTVAGKADVVSVDLGFVIEGNLEDVLPERVLCLYRLHHVAMKKDFTRLQWEGERRKRQRGLDDTSKA